jgi:type I restriction enzyme S subunit
MTATATANVPQLRFPEFSGEWVEKKLGDVASRKTLKNKENKFKYVLTNSATQGIVSQQDYFDKDIANQNNLEGYYIVEIDDFVYNPRISVSAPVGPIKRNKLAKGVMSPLYTVFAFNEDAVLGFMEMFFATNMWHDYMLSISNFGARHDRMNITTKDFIEMPILLPSLPEQTKIAAFLSAVDTKIDQLTQKKTLLETYKKGAMQQIFSQQIRFTPNEGGEYPEWEEKKLGEVANRKTLKNKENKYKYVLTNSATQGIVSQQDYFDKDIANQNNLEGYYIVDVDDFVYNPRISVFAPVGPIKSNKLAKGIMSPLYTVFAFNQNVSLCFMEMFFSTNMWHDYMLSISNFGARHDRMNITTKDFMEMPILLPCLEEQTKIANFLSAIERKIELVSQQLEQAKAFKKGLLQQMFV